MTAQVPEPRPPTRENQTEFRIPSPGCCRHGRDVYPPPEDSTFLVNKEKEYLKEYQSWSPGWMVHASGNIKWGGSWGHTGTPSPGSPSVRWEETLGVANAPTLPLVTDLQWTSNPVGR